MSTSSTPPLQWKLFSTAVILSVLLSAGCATDAQRTRAEGAGAGAVVGGAIGGLLHGRPTDALIGAGVGALAGLAVGNHVANQKQTFAQREQTLRAAAARSREATDSARAYNEQLRGEIFALEQDRQRLMAGELSARARHDLAIQDKQKTTLLLAQTNQRLAAVRAELDTQRRLINTEQAAARNQETAGSLRQVSVGVDELSGQEQSMQSALKQLQQIDNRRMY